MVEITNPEIRRQCLEVLILSSRENSVSPMTLLSPRALSGLLYSWLPRPQVFHFCPHGSLDAKPPPLRQSLHMRKRPKNITSVMTFKFWEFTGRPWPSSEITLTHSLPPLPPSSHPSHPSPSLLKQTNGTFSQWWCFFLLVTTRLGKYSKHSLFRTQFVPQI